MVKIVDLDDVEQQFPHYPVRDDEVSGAPTSIERDTHPARLSAAVTTALPILDTDVLFEQNGILYHGVLRINEQNPSEGFVLCRFGIEMMIVGDRNINRALHGDMVAVQPYNHGKDDEQHGFLDADKVHATMFQPLVPAAPKRIFGCVVGILKRARHVYRGSVMLMAEPAGSGAAVLAMFIPADARIPMFRIQVQQLEYLEEKRLVVVLDSWGCSSQYPSGHCVRNIGQIDKDKTVELPKELVRKILLHLPTFEKVVRYKVVSRSWSAIISDPWFVGAFLCRGNRRISPKEFLRIGDEFLSNVAVYSSSRFPHMMLSALFWKEYKGYMSLNQRLYRDFMIEQFTKVFEFHQTMCETIEVFGRNLTGWVAYITESHRFGMDSSLMQIDGIDVLLQQSICTYGFYSLADETDEKDLLLRIKCRRDELELLKNAEMTLFQQFVEHDLQRLELEYEGLRAKKDEAQKVPPFMLTRTWVLLTVELAFTLYNVVS